MSRSSTLWKVSAAAVPVLLLGSMSLATLSANATLASTFGADGVFKITVDGSDAASSQFDLATLKPGETANKVVMVKNVGDITAYTYLDATSVTGDPAFGAVLTGTVVGNAVSSSGPLSTLTSLSASSEAWALAPGAEIPVTLTVSAPAGATAVIEGSAGVSYAFKAVSTAPSHVTAVTFSKAATWQTNQPAMQTRWSGVYGAVQPAGYVWLSLLDIAGVGQAYTPGEVMSGGTPFTSTLVTPLGDLPGLSASNPGTYSWALTSAPTGVYHMKFTYTKLVNGVQVPQPTQYVTFTITA